MFPLTILASSVIRPNDSKLSSYVCSLRDRTSLAALLWIFSGCLCPGVCCVSSMEGCWGRSVLRCSIHSRLLEEVSIQPVTLDHKHWYMLPFLFFSAVYVCWVGWTTTVPQLVFYCVAGWHINGIRVSSVQPAQGGVGARWAMTPHSLYGQGF